MFGSKIRGPAGTIHLYRHPYGQIVFDEVTHAAIRNRSDVKFQCALVRAIRHRVLARRHAGEHDIGELTR
jgi:hypothetical protein